MPERNIPTKGHLWWECPIIPWMRREKWEINLFMSCSLMKELWVLQQNTEFTNKTRQKNTNQHTEAAIRCAILIYQLSHIMMCAIQENTHLICHCGKTEHIESWHPHKETEPYLCLKCQHKDLVLQCVLSVKSWKSTKVLNRVSAAQRRHLKCNW